MVRNKNVSLAGVASCKYQYNAVMKSNSSHLSLIEQERFDCKQFFISEVLNNIF